jgi:DNA methylase
MARGAPERPRYAAGGSRGFTGASCAAESAGDRECRCRALKRPGLVLDPFLGSGTVAMVAREHGRDWLGIELNPAHVRIAEARLGLMPGGDKPAPAEAEQVAQEPRAGRRRRNSRHDASSASCGRLAHPRAGAAVRRGWWWSTRTAPLVQWAFRAYASGDWTIRTLTEELAARDPAG